MMKYSSDGVRVALANAGDTNEVGNFETDVANAAVLRLYQLEAWVVDTMASIDTLRTDGDFAADRIFEASLDWFIEETDKSMNAMCFRDALKTSFFDLLNMRDTYKNWCAHGMVMRKDLVLRYIKVQALLMAPIAPHMAEHLWEMSGGEGLCCKASWPAVSVNRQPQYYLAGRFMIKFIDDVNSKIESGRTGKKPAVINQVHAFVALGFHDWQKAMLGILRSVYEADPSSFPPADLKKKMTDGAKTAGLDKKVVGVAMGFGDFVVKNMTGGVETFSDEYPVDQMAILQEFVPYMKAQMGLTHVELLDAAADHADPKRKKDKENAKPGQPTFFLTE